MGEFTCWGKIEGDEEDGSRLGGEGYGRLSEREKHTLDISSLHSLWPSHLTSTHHTSTHHRLTDLECSTMSDWSMADARPLCPLAVPLNDQRLRPRKRQPTY